MTDKDLAEHPNTPLEVLVELRELALNPDPYVRAAVARNASASSELLIHLSQDSDGGPRRSVAENVNTPTEVLIQLSMDPEWFVRHFVALNPKTPIAQLNQLATDENAYVREGVASNPATPQALLVSLKNDEGWGVRVKVASNPNLPGELIEELASDSVNYVREQIAANPKTPPALLVKLSRDASYEVRMQIVKRLDCPIELFELFAKDKSKKVKEILSNRNDLPVNIREQLNAQGFTTAKKVLEENAGREISLAEITAIKAVVERANLVGKVTNAQTLAALAGDDSTTVRLEVVRNRITPDEGLRKVLEECQGDFWTGVNATIVNLVIKHPNAEEHTLKLAAKMANGTNLALFFEREPHINFEMFLHILSYMNIGIGFAKVAKRNFILRSKEFSEENWRVLAENEDASIRALVAANPNTPVEYFDQLAMDSEAAVRTAVKSNKKAPATSRATAALLV